MPFQSRAQMREMFANQPEIAHRWAAMGISPNLPERVSGGKALMNASKRKRRYSQVAMQSSNARGRRIEGASTSTTRIGY
jgi:hypothetical protein